LGDLLGVQLAYNFDHMDVWLITPLLLLGTSSCQEKDWALATLMCYLLDTVRNPCFGDVFMILGDGFLWTSKKTSCVFMSIITSNVTSRCYIGRYHWHKKTKHVYFDVYKNSSPKIMKTSHKTRVFFYSRTSLNFKKKK